MRSPINIYHLDDDLLYLKRCELESERVAEPFPIPKWHLFTEPDVFLQAVDNQEIAMDAIILDVHLGQSETNGLELLERIAKSRPEIALLVHSSDIASVYRIMDGQADDFILKGAEFSEILVRICRALKTKKSRTSSGVFKRTSFQPIGRTMEAVSKRVPALVNSAVRSIYISGESGTGKEVVASLIENSIPVSQAFVRVNCAAIASSLMESELFGHTKGSFTGATSDRRGFFQQANGGWIFLDEIACLPLTTQAALLRVIENQELRRVGAQQVETVQVKIVSATNEDLEALVKSGRFRNDLWQRLCEVTIEIPPLRKRKSEISELIDFFCRTEVGGPYTMASEAKTILGQMPWSRGNVRELRNCIRAMTEFSQDGFMSATSIPDRILELGSDTRTDHAVGLQSKDGISIPIDSNLPFPSLSELESRLLISALECIALRRLASSYREAASLLGLAKSTLQSKLKRIGKNNPAVEKLFKS